MPELIVNEQQKLVPSITVSIHPTVEVVPQPAKEKEKEKEIDTTQEDVEKAIGLKITGGTDFKMAITIFHASSLSYLLRCCRLKEHFLRLKTTRRQSELG